MGKYTANLILFSTGFICVFFTHLFSNFWSLQHANGFPFSSFIENIKVLYFSAIFLIVVSTLDFLKKIYLSKKSKDS